MDRTGVTDASVKLLGRHPKLADLHIQFTKTTDAAEDEIRKVLPKCRVFKS